MPTSIPSENLGFTYSAQVHFYDCDPFQQVWHGNYIKYFEQAREAFCKKHGFSYLDVQQKGLGTPLVKVSCEHKRPLQYDDCFTVEVIFINVEAAKLVFHYRLFNDKNELVCTGKTEQVFVDKNKELVLYPPSWFLEWKKKHNLI